MLSWRSTQLNPPYNQLFAHTASDMAANVLPVLVGLATASQDWGKLWWGVVDSCEDLGCVRGRLDVALDRALNMSTIPVTTGVTLVRHVNQTEPDHGGRQVQTGVWDKLVELVTTRTINIELASPSDGRGKKKKYFDYIYAALLVAAIVIPLKLQGLALVAGKALLIAKVALALAGSALLKKLTQQGDHHHRRVDVATDPYLLAYRDH